MRLQMKKSLASIVSLFIIMSTAQSLAYETGDWIVRMGATNVSPDESSSNVVVGGNNLGLGVNVGDNTQLGLNIGYFFAPRWSVELLAATPFEHDLGLETQGSLGSTKHLPPSLTANYYLADPSAVLQPYLGAGLNYTIFFDEGFTGANRNAGFSDLDLDSSIGLTAQFGADYMINNHWHVNASVRWIDIDTDASFSLNGARGSVGVDIDPLVYTISVGYKF